MEVFSSFNNILCLVFLTTQFYFAVSEEVFIIKRASSGSDARTDFDQFQLPNSKCISHYCSPLKAHPDSHCHCKCSNPQATTFGFYSGSWTCLDNTEVRTQAGKLCQYKFWDGLLKYEQDDFPLRILEEDTRQYAFLPSSGCSVEQATSQYFTCDGRWAGINSSSISSWFIINEYEENENGRQMYEIDIGSGISDDFLGRIISLNITCPQESSCLLFKLAGTFPCAENVTSAIIPLPTTPATMTATATAAAATSGSSATANPHDKGEKETSGSSSTVIGIVVTLVIIVVIVIVIAVYVYRKRKRGESIWLVDYISSRVRNTRSTQPQKKTAEETQEDPEYAEIPEEQRRDEPVDQAGGIYTYILNDPHIAPQPAPYNRLVHNRQGTEEEGAIYSTADDGPVYNVLERSPAENHITMAPGSTMNEGPSSQDFEPEYHVLEGPNTTEETSTDVPFDTDVRASIGSANPGGSQTGHVASKERRRPPSPPRKI